MKWLFCSLGLLAACTTPVTPEEDAGVDEPIEFEGDTSGSIIPEFEPGAIDAGVLLIDAGVVVVDTTCCTTYFHIDDQEPADATGALKGQIPELASVPLTRSATGWSATVCVPVKAASYYLYAFTWDGGTLDGGPIDLDDGGVEWTSYQAVIQVNRASASEPHYADPNGNDENFYSAVETCEGHDGGVP